MSSGSIRIIQLPEKSSVNTDDYMAVDSSANGTKKVKFTDLLGFVTPEMFGAKGDGVTDDSQAWQNAVDSGYNVKATKSVYKCGQISVRNNITIDCNQADFICMDKYLFDCEGEIIDTISDADYIANQSYSISNADYSAYSGFAMLKGDNNFETSRSYYKGGFVALFDNGKIAGTYPISVTNVSIDIINPITVVIENIGKVEHTLTTDISIRSINIVYGVGCVVRNSKMRDSNGYNILVFEKCMNCISENIYINRNLLTPDNNQSYPLGWYDSSFCIARNCTIFNAKWHAITTGNIYLCYHNIVDGCKLNSEEQYAYLDHQNALNTIVINSEISSVGICGMGVVDNCVIKPLTENTYKRCQVNLIPVSIVDNAVYRVSNCKLFSVSNPNGFYVGVQIGHSAQVSGGTYYVKSCLIDNVKCYGYAQGGRIDFSLESTSNYVIYNVSINNVNLHIYLAKISTQTNIDFSNYILNLSNITEKAGTTFAWLGYTTMLFNDVNCENCNFIRIYGSFHDLTLRNVFASYAIDEDAKVSNRFLGYGIRCRVASLAFQLPAYVNITDFVWNDGEYRYNVFKNGQNSTVYGWRWNGGAMQALAIYTPS